MNEQLQQVTATSSPVTLLINGKLRLTGRIKAYDSQMVLLESDGAPYFIYRHSISQVFEQRPSARRPAPNQAKQPGIQPGTDKTFKQPNHAPQAGKNSVRANAKKATAPADSSGTIPPQPSPAQTPVEPQLPGALGTELLKWLKKSS